MDLATWVVAPPHEKGRWSVHLIEVLSDTGLWISGYLVAGWRVFATPLWLRCVALIWQDSLSPPLQWLQAYARSSSWPSGEPSWEPELDAYWQFKCVHHLAWARSAADADGIHLNTFRPQGARQDHSHCCPRVLGHWEKYQFNYRRMAMISRKSDLVLVMFSMLNKFC